MIYIPKRQCECSLSLPLSLSLSSSVVVVVVGGSSCCCCYPFAPPWILDSLSQDVPLCAVFTVMSRHSHTYTQCSRRRGRGVVIDLPIFIGIPGRRLHKVRQEQRIDAIFMRHHSHLIRIIDCVSKLPAIYSHCHSHSQSHSQSYALQLQHYFVVYLSRATCISWQLLRLSACWAIWIYSVFILRLTLVLYILNKLSSRRNVLFVARSFAIYAAIKSGTRHTDWIPDRVLTKNWEIQKKDAKRQQYCIKLYKEQSWNILEYWNAPFKI